MVTITQFISAQGGTNQASVTTASFTPENNSLLVIRGSCYAGSGDTTAQNAVSSSLGGALTITKIVERTKNQDGAGISPPPITLWIAQVGTGASMTITTSAPAGTTGFAHICTVHVVTGHDLVDPIIDFGEESTLVGMAISLVTELVDSLLIGAMSDWGNSSDVPDEDANSITDFTIADGDHQASWTGHRFVGAPGTYIIGTDTLASPAGTSAVALAIQPAAAGGITEVVGQVTETNTANAINEVKLKAVGKVTETQTAQAITANKDLGIAQVTETQLAQTITPEKTNVVGQVTETETVGAIESAKIKSVGQVSETNVANNIVGVHMPLVVQVNETDVAFAITGGSAPEDTHGWRPTLGNHCTILIQKTFDGNSTYIKRRSVLITGFASDGYPILTCKQDGTVYGTASVGIRPRSHPDANEFDVYVSY